MAHYVDGFVIPVPKNQVDAYRRMAQKAAKIWKEYGALDYRECIADDQNPKMGQPFSKGIKGKSNETVIFSWITYRTKAHRDRVNARIMKDPRLAALCDPEDMPFDCKRMLYGGFKVLVGLSGPSASSP